MWLEIMSTRCCICERDVECFKLSVKVGGFINLTLNALFIVYENYFVLF